MLEAYIDDSHTTASAFVLAGYIAPPEKWAAFSVEWQALLNMKPPLARFKMSEAHGTWSEQQWNERLPLFYGAIEAHASAGVSILIPHLEYSKVFAGKQLVKNPYHFAFVDLVGMLLGKQHELGLTEPIHFVFDKGNDERVANAWDTFKTFAPPKIQKIWGTKPQFADDERVLPLQAADLLAWLRRRKFAKRLNPHLKTRRSPWKKKRELLYLEMEWTKNRIQQAYDAMYGK